MKINNFRGELTDISARKEALVDMVGFMLDKAFLDEISRNIGYVHLKFICFCNEKYVDRFRVSIKHFIQVLKKLHCSCLNEI